MCALGRGSKGGTLLGIQRDFFKCTKYSASVPGTFSLMEEQSRKSPASSFLSRAVHPSGTGWWSPHTPGPLWSCPHPVIWWQSSGPALSGRSSPAWSSHDSELWASIGRTHRCDGPRDALSFFLLLLASNHWVLVGKQPLLLHPAPEPAPVD